MNEPWRGIKLLTWGDENPKTAKSNKLGDYYTAILHLSPAGESGYQCCAWHSDGCAATCLHTAGDPGFLSGKIRGRFKKTIFLAKQPDLFLQQLNKEISEYREIAINDGRKLAVRLNGTSDIPWESGKYSVKGMLGILMHEFPDVYFYDYTKSPLRMQKSLIGKFPTNYHLTYSHSEGSDPDKFLEKGGNVAIVFNVHRRHSLPLVWQTGSGKKVNIIDGDKHDLRFLDPRGIVVGLRAKGDALWDKTGFVIQPDNWHLDVPENREWVGAALGWRAARESRFKKYGAGGPGYHKDKSIDIRKRYETERQELLAKYSNLPSKRLGLPVVNLEGFRYFMESSETFIGGDRVGNIFRVLLNLPKRQIVEFSLYCVKDCLNLVSDEFRGEVDRRIYLIERWLENPRSISRSEMEEMSRTYPNYESAINYYVINAAAAGIDSIRSTSGDGIAGAGSRVASIAANAHAYSVDFTNQNEIRSIHNDKILEYLMIAQHISKKANTTGTDTPNPYQLSLLKKVDVGRMFDILQDLGHSPFTHKDGKYHLDLFGGISGESPSEIASEIERRHLGNIFRNIVLSSFDK